VSKSGKIVIIEEGNLLYLNKDLTSRFIKGYKIIHNRNEGMQNPKKKKTCRKPCMFFLKKN